MSLTRRVSRRPHRPRAAAGGCSTVEAALGKRPVVYVTGESYRRVIAGSGIENRLWVRDLVREPRPPRGEEWASWQFHARGRVRGVDRAVDLDAYRSELGPLDELYSQDVAEAGGAPEPASPGKRGAAHRVVGPVDGPIPPGVLCPPALARSRSP